jgi:hypothetical protein
MLRHNRSISIGKYLINILKILASIISYAISMKFSYRRIHPDILLD